MDNRKFSDLGDQIRDSVQSAIDSRDFRQLNRAISDTVNSALDEARSQLLGKTKKEEFTVDGTYEEVNEESGEPSKSHGKPSGSTSSGSYQRAENPGYRAFQTSRSQGGVSSSRTVKTGKVAGILFTVFGSIGLGFMAILLLVVWFLSMVIRPAIWSVAGASAILLAAGGGFGLMMARGIAWGTRLKRADIYIRQCEGRMYAAFPDLAKSVGKSRDFVRRDVQKIIDLGIIPQARMDEQKTCLILGDDAYKQYLECQKSLKERELNQAREEKEKEKEKEKAAGKTDGKKSKELEQMLESGRSYLKILEEANEAIPGQVISQKISRLEDVIRRIFDTVLKHPEQLEEMERFMEYYLPTTVKLVTAYRDFDGAGTQGANVASAKKEIEETLDTINQAFERLLDDLYHDAALDITTDASVLQTMLKKDGWAESDFTGGKKDE